MTPSLAQSHREGHFESCEGETLFEQWWLPDAGMQAMIVIVHGIAEHSGRYAHVGEYFCQHGFGVGSFDLCGHGRSNGKKAYIKSFSNLLDDLAVFIQRAKEQAPGKPIFLLGHSLGSGIVARYMIDYDLGGVHGAVLSGPLVVIGSSIPPALIKAARVLGAITPKLPVLKLDNTTVSRDPAVRENYDTDPLNYRGKLRARTGDQINQALQYIQANMEKISLPMLIVVGSQDKLVDPAGAHMLYEKASSKDKTLKVYEGLYHEVLNEPEKEQVMDDILAWISARLTGADNGTR
ncbi:MAG: lysophospholipase [Anaerolineaceae bacterium]